MQNSTPVTYDITNAVTTNILNWLSLIHVNSTHISRHIFVWTPIFIRFRRIYIYVLYVTYVQLNPRLLKALVCYMSPNWFYHHAGIIDAGAQTKNVQDLFLLWKGHLAYRIKIFLQSPKYLIIIVNRFTYSNNRITKNKSYMPLDLYIKLGLYEFSLQASVDHHGYFMNSGHYTASINFFGKTFHCNDNKLLNAIPWILIIHLLPKYFCTNSSWNVRAALSSVYSLTTEDGSWSTTMVPAQLSLPLQQVEE